MLGRIELAGSEGGFGRGGEHGGGAAPLFVGGTKVDGTDKQGFGGGCVTVEKLHLGQ